MEATKASGASSPKSLFPTDLSSHLRQTFVPIDVPFLIGLDFLHEFGLCIYLEDSCLTSKKQNWKIPINYQDGHAHIQHAQIPFVCCYTEQELLKLHQTFMHPLAGKLYNLLKKAQPEKANPNVKKLLESISRNFASCTTFSVPPFKFQGSIPPEDIIFNREVAIYLMWLNGQPVLHVVVTATNFRNAIFLKMKSTTDIWRAFIDCWTSVYIGFPEIIRLSRESTFMSEQFRKNAKEEASTYNSVASSLIMPLGKEKDTTDHYAVYSPSWKKNTDPWTTDTSSRSAKWQFTTQIGPNELVPTLLVFGVLSALPCLNTKMPDQIERFVILRTAKGDMEKILAKTRIKWALRSKLPSANKFLIKPGVELLVYWEISKNGKGRPL